MKIYVMHKKGLAERLFRVVDLLMKCRSVSDVEIITTEEPNVEFCSLDKKLQVIPADFPRKEVTLKEKSLYYKHYRTFQKIVEDGSPSIIFEDDVVFDPSNLDVFVDKLSEIPTNWDWVFFGTGCNLSIDGTGFVENTNRFKSKCTDSMLVHPRAAKKFLNDVQSTSAYLPIDWELNYRFLKLDMNVYWHEPGLVVQGSELGIYKSEIR
jgi:GR25 family glycosyltransferase involved in LPS biosynthesis